VPPLLSGPSAGTPTRACCLPVVRTAAGYRLYDSEALARLELIQTPREIGLDLPVIKKVLAREVKLADVAAAHADAL